ncbi:MAG: hypothetical protein DRI95_14190 [Bacteroidetes bacterium]|nr:MAG: hypothetical protein DRI95_14190 [Bacteroidota bacterium]RLD85769.1 MAG: hypothetical protein DRJ07_02365 [Bacteroidota bacterium]
MNKSNNIDLNFLQEFEDGMNPANATNSSFNFEILGYGEISTVFGIDTDENANWAFKRLPLFKNLKQAEDYVEFYKSYNHKLEEIGLNLPECSGFAVKGHKGIYVTYLMQKRLNSKSIAHKLIHQLPDNQITVLLHLVLNEILKVWKHNQKHPDLVLGIDAQISNWALKDYDEQNINLSENSELYFIDTSTPLIQKNNLEQLDAELMLKSAPGFIRPVLRWFFLDDVLTRYYSFRDIAIDILANFIKEQRKDLIKISLPIINNFFKEHFDIIKENPIKEKEILSYYKEDKLIWSIFLATRRFDKFVKTKILRKRYEFILPGQIKR